MELILVRHALPVRIDVAPGGGAADPGLAEKGHEQAARVPDALRHDRVDVVYSSPARRALETAAPLVEALGAELRIEPGITEFDSEDPSYVPVEELKAAGDPRWERLVRGDLYTADVDPAAFRTRVVEGVERVVAAHPGGTAVLFTHSGAINAYAGHVLGQERSIWFGPAYCSITRIAASREGRRGVLSLNETAHVRDLI